MNRDPSSTPRRLAAVSLVAFGLGLNKWALEATLVSGGRIDSLAVNLLIALIQLSLIGLAVLVWLRRDRWIASGATSLASLVLVVVILEGAFRILGIKASYPSPRRDEVLVDPDAPTERAAHAFIPLATVRSTYSLDPRGYFDPGGTIDHVHNSAGWRDEEHTVEKPAGHFRVLGLGDSYLWGQGVRPEDVVLKRLGVLLKEQIPGMSIETINAGVSGTNTVHQRDLLLDRGLDYDPDLIVLFYVLNDVEKRPGARRPRIEFFRQYTSIYQRPDRLSRYSYVWGWARQRFLRSYVARQYVHQCIDSFTDNQGKWDRSRGALDDIHRMSREREIPLIVVIFPFLHNLDGDYPFQILHDLVREYCESASIPVLDLRDSYREYRGPELWVHPTDQHPNEIAHAIAAQAIAEFLGDDPELIARRLATSEPGPGSAR